MVIVLPTELDNTSFLNVTHIKLKYEVYLAGYTDVVLGLLNNTELVLFTELDIQILTNTYFINRPLTEVDALEYNDFYDEHMADFTDYLNKVFNRESLKYLEELAEVAYMSYKTRFVKPEKPKSFLRRLYEKFTKKAV